jgi:hypothetical protein
VNIAALGRQGSERRTRLRRPPESLVAITFAALLVLLSTPRPASACVFGHRIRLYPLGTVSQEIVVAQIDEHRLPLPHHGGAPFASKNLYWAGELRLRRFTAAGRMKPGHVSLGRTVSRAIYYYLDNRRALARALKRARQIPGFKPLPPPRLIRCASLGRCGQARIVARGLAIWVERAAAQGRLLAAREVRAMAKKTASMDGRKSPAPGYANQINAAYLLAYRWANRWILVAPLSAGLSKTLGMAVGWRPRYCRSVATCIPPAPIYDHQLLRDGLTVLPAQQGTASPVGRGYP